MIATVDTDPSQRAELLFQALSQGTQNYLSILSKGADITARNDDRTFSQEQETNRHGLALRQFRQNQLEDSRNFQRSVFEDNRDFGFRAHQSSLSNSRAQQSFDHRVEQDRLRSERQSNLDALNLERQAVIDARAEDQFAREQEAFDLELRQREAQFEEQQRERENSTRDESNDEERFGSDTFSNAETPNPLSSSERIRLIETRASLLARMSSAGSPDVRAEYSDEISRIDTLLGRNTDSSQPPTEASGGDESLTSPADSTSGLGGVEPTSSASTNSSGSFFKPARPAGERNPASSAIVDRSSNRLNFSENEQEYYDDTVSKLKDLGSKVTNKNDTRNSPKFNQDDFEEKILKAAEKIVNRIAPEGKTSRRGGPRLSEDKRNKLFEQILSSLYDDVLTRSDNARSANSSTEKELFDEIADIEKRFNLR